MQAVRFDEFFANLLLGIYNMKKVILLSLLPLTAMAAPSLRGIVETYQNWDLICDNTGTCNMAGYQDGSDLVSLLFRREAGEKAAVKSSLAISVNNERRITFFMLSIPKRKFAKNRRNLPAYKWAVIFI